MISVLPLGPTDWMVPSRSKPGYFARVTIDGRDVSCSCPNGVALAAVGRMPNCHHLDDVTEFLRPRCGMGLNGLSCNLPAGHVAPLHSWEDATHAARVESFLDRQDAANRSQRRAS